MVDTSFTDSNTTSPSIQTRARPHLSIFHVSTLLGIGTLIFCLLFPLSPTPANSNDMANALSSHSTAFINQPNQSTNSASSHSDDILAALTIYLEARGESFAGKMAVAAVIRNRIQLKYHSDGTIRGTVLRRKQFEPWIGRSPNDVRFNPNNRKMQESLLAWELVQDGRNVVDGAVLFYNPSLVNTPRWAKVYQKVSTIGGHEFFNKRLI